MRNKAYIVISVLILIILVIVLLPDRSLEKRKPIESINKPIESIQNNNGNDPVLKYAKKKPILNKNLQVSEEIIDELSQQKFSSEPFVELLTVTYLLQECTRNSVTDFEKKSKQIEKLLVTRSEKCLEIISDYPLLVSKRRAKEIEMLIMKMALQSKFADVMQKGMTMKYMNQKDKIKFIEEVIVSLLKSQNGPLITSIDEIIQVRQSGFFVNELAKELGTININYCKLITQQAIVLYSCQFSDSMTCLPSSKYMLRQCNLDEKACGVDVPTWFKLSHTAAHNRDIDILVRYLDAQAMK